MCLLNVGVFTREDRHTDDMKNKQAGIAHEELKTDRKAWIFGGGVPYIYMMSTAVDTVFLSALFVFVVSAASGSLITFQHANMSIGTTIHAMNNLLPHVWIICIVRIVRITLTLVLTAKL